MKTIATAAVLVMLSAPAWAEEPKQTQTNDPANIDEPIALSEAEMDGVTAGTDVNTDKTGRVKVQFHWDREGNNTSASKGESVTTIQGLLIE